jgi:hypothetical protein
MLLPQPGNLRMVGRTSNTDGPLPVREKAALIVVECDRRRSLPTVAAQPAKLSPDLGSQTADSPQRCFGCGLP